MMVKSNTLSDQSSISLFLDIISPSSLCIFVLDILLACGMRQNSIVFVLQDHFRDACSPVAPSCDAGILVTCEWDCMLFRDSCCCMHPRQVSNSSSWFFFRPSHAILHTPTNTSTVQTILFALLVHKQTMQPCMTRKPMPT